MEYIKHFWKVIYNVTYSTVYATTLNTILPSSGGEVIASLTSDSPALVGSNVSFTVTLRFPRCQKEDNDSNIVYDRKCVNGE